MAPFTIHWPFELLRGPYENVSMSKGTWTRVSRPAWVWGTHRVGLEGEGTLPGACCGDPVPPFGG